MFFYDCPQLTARYSGMAQVTAQLPECHHTLRLLERDVIDAPRAVIVAETACHGGEGLVGETMGERLEERVVEGWGGEEPTASR